MYLETTPMNCNKPNKYKSICIKGQCGVVVRVLILEQNVPVWNLKLSREVWSWARHVLCLNRIVVDKRWGRSHLHYPMFKGGQAMYYSEK